MEVYLGISELHVVQVHALKSLNICVHLQNHLHHQEGACPYSLKVFCLFVFFLFGWQQGRERNKETELQPLVCFLQLDLVGLKLGAGDDRNPQTWSIVAAFQDALAGKWSWSRARQIQALLCGWWLKQSLSH